MEKGHKILLGYKLRICVAIATCLCLYLGTKVQFTVLRPERRKENATFRHSTSNQHINQLRIHNRAFAQFNRWAKNFKEPLVLGQRIYLNLTEQWSVAGHLYEFSNLNDYIVNMKVLNKSAMSNTDACIGHFQSPTSRRFPGGNNTSNVIGMCLLQQEPIKFLTYMKNPCWYDSNKVLRCLPYFYLIGAPKCGTTDIYLRIAKHPDYIKASTKEPHWISRHRFFRSKNVKPYFQDYLTVFSYLTNRLNNGYTSKDRLRSLITGDCSASTLWFNDFWDLLPGNENPLEPSFTNADVIRHLNPGAKIIVIFRNPVARLYSDYLYFTDENVRKSPEDFHMQVVNAVNSFQLCVRLTSVRSCVYNQHVANKTEVRLRVGIYYVYMLEWLRLFPRQQILILRLEDHSPNPSKTMETVFQFLDMHPLPLRQQELVSSLHRSNSRRTTDLNVGPMWKETRRLLYSFYKPYNMALANLLEDDRFNYGP